MTRVLVLLLAVLSAFPCTAQGRHGASVIRGGDDGLAYLHDHWRRFVSLHTSAKSASVFGYLLLECTLGGPIAVVSRTLARMGIVRGARYINTTSQLVTTYTDVYIPRIKTAELKPTSEGLSTARFFHQLTALPLYARRFPWLSAGSKPVLGPHRQRQPMQHRSERIHVRTPSYAELTSQPQKCFWLVVDMLSNASCTEISLGRVVASRSRRETGEETCFFNTPQTT